MVVHWSGEVEWWRRFRQDLDPESVEYGRISPRIEAAEDSYRRCVDELVELVEEGR
jgi:hypothetical protein